MKLEQITTQKISLLSMFTSYLEILSTTGKILADYAKPHSIGK